jgi:hypothetical protein
MWTVQLNNGQWTSGGTGPGLVTVPAEEAQPLIDAGYATLVQVQE